jgi:hypothetical protein
MDVALRRHPLLLAALVLASGCAPALAAPAAPAPETRYAAALEDAAVFEARDLRRLVPARPDADGTVLAATLKAAAWEVGERTLDGEVWVTVVPEVRDSCASWEAEDIAAGLRQLLGLQPTQPVAYFMELRVPVDSMFRPAANPAVGTDALCDAAGDGGGECALRLPASAPRRHVRWMAEQMLSAWRMPDGYPVPDADWRRLGYPWTRLGYTYNWRPGADRYGASEYVVRAGTPVTVTAVHTIAAYCARS